MDTVKPFKINISDIELDILSQKLALARLPPTSGSGENNGVTSDFMHVTVSFWRTKYDWRTEEAKLNEMAQFVTSIDVGDYGVLEIHFVHAHSQSSDNAIPLLFLHGWPGSFAEVQKILPLLTKAGFDVVAPSLPGYGFSSYPPKPGFKHRHHSEVMNKLILKLGYDKYVVQGGDWGADIARTVAVMFPTHVKALHQNMLMMVKPDFPSSEPQYSYLEKTYLKRFAWFQETNSAYDSLQSSRPNTLGFAMHDSPVEGLAWMADKLFLWSDEYPWTRTEIITWTLLHYFPGPTTGFLMYFENNPSELLQKGSDVLKYIDTPTGYSAFPKELGIMPRSWAATIGNVVFWQTHESGGHFAAYEKPNELAGDLVRFFKPTWETK